jgi:SAM-dependent methyltransferase
MNIVKMYNNLSNWGKILVFCVLFLILVVLFKSVKAPQIKEGYAQNDAYLLKNGEDIYDDFYADIYDELVYNDMKDDYEINQLVDKTGVTEQSNILDVGSGTGHHVAKLNEQGYRTIGMDISPAMLKKAKDNFPSCKFMLGDATGSPDVNYNSFTHILSLYFTVYYMKNKNGFFINCMNWLIPGGYLLLHLVDRETFDPILPAGQGFLIVSPQKYSNKRITKTKVTFDNFVYNADFDLNEDKNIAIFNEKIKFKDTDKVRQNQHILYMEDKTTILNMAQQSGFIVDGEIDLMNTGYDSQYIYILRKPS